MSKQRFAELVEEALAEVPPPFDQHLEEMTIEIRPRPSERQLARVGIGRGKLLLGLYEGRPLTLRSVEHSGTMPDRIFIFQEPIELVCEDEEQLRRQVRTTVLHEIGHHFGMSEQDLDDLGYG